LTTSFVVTPDEGYSIDTVTGCGGTLDGNSYTTGGITTACTVSASFTLNSYPVTPSAGENGSISPDSPQMVDYGLTTSFVVMPDEGYSIDTVTGCGGTLAGNAYTTGTITGPCTVTASFREIDSDGDGIDDAWEEYWFGDLTSADAKSDFDKDGYSDLREYLNWLAGETDPEGGTYDPTEKNAPGGTGWHSPTGWLPAVNLLLLMQ
jgi:hypothetical protein